MMKITKGRKRGICLLSLLMVLVVLAAGALGSVTTAFAERKGIPDLDIQ